MKENTRIDGRYALGALIGSGGEARVFRARDLVTAQDVAVRLPLSGPEAPRAGQAALPAFHPGWVQLLATGRDAQQGNYQVLELLEGETLHRIISRAQLDPVAWLAFVRQSLDAVGAVHAAGAVHGDLNADNFFRMESASTVWKLLELPFLRLAAPAGRSSLFGSIHTLAPELLQGRAPDAGSDLYALGCLYYYAASGVYPHAAPTSQDMAINRLRFPPEPLREKAPGLPGPLVEWVMTLLAADPAQRPASLAAARHLLAIA